MRATSRFKIERPIPQDHALRLVASIGLRHTLGSNAKGLMERCEFKMVELPDPVAACRVLETIEPGAVVLDTHHPILKRDCGTVIRLLQILDARANEGRHTPLIVLSSAGVSDEVRRVFVRAGALLLPNRLQTYRQIATLVRRLCGLPDGCCAVGDSPEDLL